MTIGGAPVYSRDVVLLPTRRVGIASPNKVMLVACTSRLEAGENMLRPPGHFRHPPKYVRPWSPESQRTGQLPHRQLSSL